MADLEVASAKGVYRKMDMIKAVNLKNIIHPIHMKCVL